MLWSTIESTRPWSWSSVRLRWNLFFMDWTELAELLKQGSCEPALMYRD